MQSIAIRGTGEYMKMLVKEEIVWGVTTTYVGVALYWSNNENLNYKESTDTSKPIWKIKKTIETIVWGVTDTETFFPIIDGKLCKETLATWDDILTYTYL